MPPGIGVCVQVTLYCVALAPVVYLGPRSYVKSRFPDLQWIPLDLLEQKSLDVVDYKANSVPPPVGRRMEKGVGTIRMRLSSRQQKFSPESPFGGKSGV